MIKKVAIAVCLSSLITIGVMAQGHMPNQVNTYSDEGNGTGFLKQNLFVGGSLGLGWDSYDFNVGLNPEVGYSLNRWLDVGLVGNFSYYSEKADPSGLYNPDIRTHQFVYGGGAFARVYPLGNILPWLFFTVQPEFNWTNVKETYMADGEQSNYTANAPSLLLGIGYSQRIVGQSNFYLALMVDCLGNKNSPYNDYNGNPIPVLRAGFDIFVHKNR